MAVCECIEMFLLGTHRMDLEISIVMFHYMVLLATLSDSGLHGVDLETDQAQEDYNNEENCISRTWLFCSSFLLSNFQHTLRST